MRITKSVWRWVAIPTALALLLALVLVPLPVKASPEVAIAAEGAYNADFSKGPFATADEGASFWVKINVGASGDTVTDFDAADYLITYDVAVLSVAMTDIGGGVYEVTTGNIADGEIGAGGPTGTPNVPVVKTREIGTHGSGVIKVVNNVEGYTGLSGYGYLCAIKFTVIGSDDTSSAITPSQVTLSDVGANEIATATPTAVTITVDKLEVTVIVVVGETNWDSAVTNEGYVSDGDTTTFTLTATVTGGCAAYTVGTPYDWTSAGGTFGADPDTDATNTVTYAIAGTKNDITVRVTDDLGSTTEGYEATATAIVYDTFIFNFTEDRNEGIQGDTRATKDNTIAFASTAGAGDGSYTYLWSFGGGTGTNTLADPDVTFAPPGTRAGLIYIVGVTGKDTLAAEITPATHSITIYQLGDVNGDLAVKATDITKSERIVGVADSATFTSDVNMSGTEDAGDITATEVAVAESHE